MNTIILKSFISRLDFISKKIEYSNSETYEIIIENINNNEVSGIFVNKNNSNDTIKFKIQIKETDDILVFKSSLI